MSMITSLFDNRGAQNNNVNNAFSSFGSQNNQMANNFGSQFSQPSFLSALLPLIMALLEQLQGGGGNPGEGNPGGGNPGGGTPSGGGTPGGGNPGGGTDPQELQLTDAERNIMRGTYAADASGTVPAGQTVSVVDNDFDGKISGGDTLTIKDANGNDVSQQQLADSDIYEIQFRENMVRNVENAGRGWDFDSGIVTIKDAAVQPPESRQYTENDGSTATETVVERNDLWEVVERGPNRYLLMRETDDQGNAVKPSDALNDIFNNKDDYGFDCASPMPLFNMKAIMDTVGEDDFNQNAGQMLFGSWYDNYDNSNFDGGYISSVRTADAGEVNVDGTTNLAGETAIFDPAKGDELKPGSVYYFDLPGDDTSDIQGWNAIYLGQNDDGSHRFWSSSIGQVNVSFEDNSWIAEGRFDDYYLGAAVSDPNTQRMQNWDTDGSVTR